MLMTSLRTSTAIAMIFMAQLALSQPVYAGGLGEPILEPVVIKPAAPLSWGGSPYVGIQIGCSFLNHHPGIQSENGPCDGISGVHLGYNFAPNGNFVWGGEIDVSSSDHQFAGAATGGNTVSANWEATARLRLGYMVNEKTTLYTAGGLAFAGAEMEGVGSNTHTGWTVGLGVERSFSEHWLGRFEIRHNEFGSATYETPTGPFDVEFGDTQAIFGLSYKF